MVVLPTLDDVSVLARSLDLALGNGEAETIRAIAQEFVGLCDQLETLPEPKPAVIPAMRDAGSRPQGSHNRCNAFIRRCSVKAAHRGPLAGQTVGLKDNIALAGVEMTLASSVMRGFVPDVDATVTTRLISAGAEIVGKMNLSAFSNDGSGFLSAFGPVLNPFSTDHLAGGSSSGCAAAVVNGDIDIGIGGDQGGSIRIPAAWCGCIGLKPTRGLVPYTGIVGLDSAIDCAGPMVRSAPDCAVALEAIAGDDGYDPLCRGVQSKPYGKLLDSDLNRVRIGVVAEGFQWEVADAAVMDKCRKAIARFRELGAEVQEVSIPAHRHGGTLLFGYLLEAIAAQMRNGIGFGYHGFRDSAFAEFCGNSLSRTHGSELPITVKASLVMGEYLTRRYFGHYYAKASNLSRWLAGEYDAPLSRCDMLAMPTVLTTAPKNDDTLRGPDVIHRAWGMAQNTAAFNMTGHPALSFPVGQVRGLPVGLMLVGRHFEEEKLLSAVYSYQEKISWLDE